MCHHRSVELIANRETESESDDEAAETPPPLVPPAD
jgi:hypothetical protein